MVFPTTSQRVLAVLFLLVRSTQGLYFFYDDGSATCSSDDIGFVVDSFNVACNGGICKTGEVMTVDGTVTASTAFPETPHVVIKACTFGGVWCTGSLASQTLDVCNYLEMESITGSSSCPSGGEYSFEKTVTIPTALDQFTMGGFGFRLYAYLTYESDSVSCYAHFTTASGHSTGRNGYGMGMTSVAVMGFAAAVAYGVRRRRRLVVESSSRSEETGFEMMGDEERAVRV